MIEGASKLDNGSSAAKEVRKSIEKLKECLASIIKILLHSHQQMTTKALTVALQSSKDTVNHKRATHCLSTAAIGLLVSHAVSARQNSKHKPSEHKKGDHVINCGVLDLCDKAIRGALPEFGINDGAIPLGAEKARCQYD